MNHSKKLSIIIPFYGQSVEELAIPLRSINRQLGVDFDEIDVHFVNDGGESIEPERLKVFTNLDLHYHELKENAGPGLARQYGIDHSDSEWLMFVDADDELNGEGALSYFYQVEKFDAQAQVLMSDFVAEMKNDEGKLIYKTYNYQTDLSFASVCAKWFRRDFINELGLRFSEKLRVLEDAYFTDIATVIGDKIVGFDGAKTYLVHYREGSLTHSAAEKEKFDATNCVIKERLELDFFLKQAPEKFETRMDNSLVGLYFYQQNSPAVDESAFRSEITKYAQEFLPLYKIKFAKLMPLAKAKSLQGESTFFGLDTSGFKTFLDFVKRQAR